MILEVLMSLFSNLRLLNNTYGNNYDKFNFTKPFSLLESTRTLNMKLRNLRKIPKPSNMFFEELQEL
jgi:hypothetical protein